MQAHMRRIKECHAKLINPGLLLFLLRTSSSDLSIGVSEGLVIMEDCTSWHVESAMALSFCLEVCMRAGGAFMQHEMQQYSLPWNAGAEFIKDACVCMHQTQQSAVAIHLGMGQSCHIAELGTCTKSFLDRFSIRKADLVPQEPFWRADLELLLGSRP